MVAASPYPQSGQPSNLRGVPPGQAGGIEIVNATYGGNCGASPGNVVAHLAQSCSGQARCSYRVVHTVIGDPAYGCQKDYVAEWRCAGSPQTFRAVAAAEAGFGSVVELACAGAVAAAPPPPPPPPASYPPPPSYPPPATQGGIRIVAGSYGQNCRAPHGNKTPHLQQTCEGQATCAYRVDYKVIGDPAYGCQKDYVAEFTCGADPTVRRAQAGPEAGFGSIVNLTCDGGGGVVATPAPRGSRPIVVRTGSYGPNCGAPRGNVTTHLAQTCNGRSECAYRVDYKVIGDPVYGCQKEYVAEWTCGRHPHVHRASAPPEAGFGSTVELRCQ
jgi:hypothetical protein